MRTQTDANVFARRKLWDDTIELVVMYGRNAAGLAIVPKMGVQVLDEGAMFPPDAMFELNGTLAQKLMDELWICGIRPSEGSGSAGALAATQAHLKDMQRLVFELVIPPRVSIEGMTRLHPRDPS